MADASKINLYGMSYNIKDTSARSIANAANTNATQAKTDATGAKTVASTANESINFAQGITLPE